MNAGLTAILVAALLVGSLGGLFWLLVNAARRKRQAFVTFASDLGANAETDPGGGPSVSITLEGRRVRVFMTESNRFSYANLETPLATTALELVLHNARSFQKAELLTGHPEFDAAFQLRSNDAAAARELLTDEIRRLLLQTPYDHDVHSQWTIGQGMLRYRALPPVTQFDSGLDNPEFHQRFRTALRAAILMASRIDAKLAE
jgi:hypothetical protein